MSRFTKYGKTTSRFASCSRQKGEPIVHRGLSVPPSKLLSMASQGVAISTSNASQFFDGVDNPSWDLPMETQRGIDVATLWEHQQGIKNKMRNGLKSDIQTYGE